jgi:ribosomal protein L6P/L9E
MIFGLPKLSKRTRLTFATQAKETACALAKVSGPFAESSFVFPSGIWTSLGLFDAKARKGNLVKTAAQLMEVAHTGSHKLFRESLNLYGIGYKAYAPKKFGRSSLVLRAGFGAAELRVKGSKTLKIRARKQRILLASPIKERLSAFRGELVLLKRTNPYTGKGIRITGTSYRKKQGKIRVR